MKILFITPHLSTGGAPQYLFKKIQELHQDHEIYCIEYNDLSGNDYIVQKNKIRELLKENLITLDDNKYRLLDELHRINPDIVHFEELPEYFCGHEITKRIYNKDRSYKIIETSHDSSFEISNKSFLPDKFIFVSEFQRNLFESLGVETDVIEYPIEYKTKKNRTESLIELGLDPNKHHIFNIGLFTPRKNQAEIIEYAKKFENENVQFHFIGNQADNFKSYWEPLMENFPPNCKWWGEQSDVDKFYNAMDLFLFTSRGTNNDKETSPLVLREAIGWNVPILMYDLDVYNKMHHKFDNVTFLNKFDLDFNINLIKNKLNIFKTETINKNDFAIIVTCHPNSKIQEELTKTALKHLNTHDIDIILTSHYPVSKEIEEMCEFSIYDKNNVFTKHSYIDTAWFDYPSYYASLNMNTQLNFRYHGPAVYINYFNGISFAKSMGYKHAICINYDLILDDIDNLTSILEMYLKKRAYYRVTDSVEGYISHTTFFITNVDFFLDVFKPIKTSSQYDELCEETNSSATLEKLFYNILHPHEDDIYIEKNDFNEYFPDFYTNANSMCEYFTILPVLHDSNKFVIWYSSSNLVDNRLFKLKINNVNIVTLIKNNFIFYKTVNTPEFQFPINITLSICDGYDCETELYNKSIEITPEYMSNMLQKNGIFKIK